ncbi:hypothetical protein AGMMS49991_09690 [Spirochaetia bacterium]|nr:hypothetical protein AGMMS49991_09690 [Spirochaetia bacterium]
MKMKFFGKWAALLLPCALVLSSCGALLTPPKGHEVKAEYLLPEFKPVVVTEIEACCTGSGSAANIIDGSTGTFWGTLYNDGDTTSDAYHAHGTGHYLNLDLGQSYDYISRVEYIPNWAWGNPQGYSANNNGVCQEFEVYVTETKLLPGEAPPAESLAGYGEWVALENGSNTITTSAKQKFVATFSGVKGRYVQFLFVSAYRNHWNGYPRTAKIANAAELNVFASEEPFAVSTGSLSLAIAKAEALRAAYPTHYGYTNAILDNWTGKGKTYFGSKATQEMVDYVLNNLNNYIGLFSRRAQAKTYDRFIPKIIWADDKGNHLQAHGGGVMYDPVGKKWWFYGEDRTYNGGGQAGVHGYSSDDLYNWKDEGLALPVFNNTEYDTFGWKADDWDGSTDLDETHKSGFVYNVNVWRKALGDWNCDGVIDGSDAPYQIEAALKTEITARNVPWWDGIADPIPRTGTDTPGVSRHDGAYFTDEQTLVDTGNWPTADEAWAKIKDYIPSGNPPLYIEASAKANPHPGSLGLDSAKIAAFNALYSGEPVWRRKQLYRYYNYQSIIERPKVVYNASTGKYMMFVHMEGGTYDSSYGTSRVAIAEASNPAGPYKLLWAYRVHFVENTHSSDNGLSKGMTRDQGVLVDADGTAYQFGSSEENRFMAINKLKGDYRTFEGIPAYASGGNQNEMLIEGYQNKMGENFNWIFGNQREAPAPFIHYLQDGMTADGDGAYGTVAPLDSVKRYYAVTSYSSGWFPNQQGMYRTAASGNYILGANPHNKPATGSLAANTNNNATGAPGTNWQSGNGWIETQNDPNSNNGSVSGSVLFGEAGDGSHVNRGYDGQTTHVFQLRYPDHPWGLTGYADAGYAPPTGYDGNPAGYYAALDALTGYTKPIYGERVELSEPRAGKLVYGKYVYLSDSWDQYKNYDARYIWLPMRVLNHANNNDNNGGRRGVSVRWMNQWRWQDFVYDLGPFVNSLSATTGSTGLWRNVGLSELEDYDEMLGSIDAFLANAGKQNPGQQQ